MACWEGLDMAPWIWIFLDLDRPGLDLDLVHLNFSKKLITQCDDLAAVQTCDGSLCGNES